MKRFFVLVMTISAGVSSVCANLGDGGDRIDDSYGKLVERHLRDDGTVSTLYHKDRYLYLVVFDHGVSVLEKYSRVESAAGQVRDHITQAQALQRVVKSGPIVAVEPRIPERARQQLDFPRAFFVWKVGNCDLPGGTHPDDARVGVERADCDTANRWRKEDKLFHHG